MNANRKINSNWNNTDSYDVSINILEERLQPETDNELATSKQTIVEPDMAKLFITEDSASRSARRQDEKGKTNDDDDEQNENEESADETDGTRKKLCFVEMDEVSNTEEIEIEEVEPKKISSYAAKKTVAQGMMDIALITANANQLRYIIEFNRNSSTFYFIVTLIIISLMLQVAVGMALIFKGRLDIKGRSKDPDAKRINNYVVVSIFLVTIINVFIASFTITGNSGKTQ